MELKKIRTQKGLTQQAVADGIQCSTTVYARYERGEREPSIEMLLRLSAFFDVTVDYLLGTGRCPEHAAFPPGTKEKETPRIVKKGKIIYLFWDR